MIDPAIVLKRLVDVLVMPPGGPLIAIAIGLVAMKWRPRAGRIIATLGLVAAVLCATNGFGDMLSDIVEGNLVGLRPEQLAKAMASDHPPQAVVILSGGSEHDTREYPGPDGLLGRSLIRVLQGSRVARASGLPVLVTGGSVVMDKAPEASVMARILRDDFHITPRWVESGSLDTAENASNSAQVLHGVGIDSVILVTDALHMRRAASAFEAVGLSVLPAPIGFSGAAGGDRTFAWLPTAIGAGQVWAASHEVVGWWWYKLRRSMLRSPTS